MCHYHTQQYMGEYVYSM
uniref:Uncharacterized protein n=1 Tax=Anguilla anguilla TaxID=7936 RepID=A0A0E9TGL8_ANGAN